MNMTILYHKKHSTYQETLKWLDANGVQYRECPIKEEHLSEAELKAWYEKSGLSSKKFSDISGNLYKEMVPKDKFPQMSEEEQLVLLATGGVLVKRPPVVANDFVLAGFKGDEWREEIM